MEARSLPSRHTVPALSLIHIYRQGHSQIYRCAVRAHAAYHVDIDVLVDHSHADLFFQHRQNHVEPLIVHAYGGTAREAHVGRRGQGLYLKEHRSAAFVDGGDHRSLRAGLRALQEGSRQVADLLQSPFFHLKRADFAGGPEPILVRSEDTKIVIPLAGKIEDAVYQVLHDLRAGQLAALCHVSHDKDGDIPRLSQLHQLVADIPHLGYASRYGIQRLGVHGLDRIDDQKFRPQVFAGRGDLLHVGLGQDIQVIAELAADPVRPHFDLFFGFFSGDIEDRTQSLSQVGRGLHDHGGLADARLSGDQRQGTAHQAASQNPVQFTDARIDSLILS